MSGAAEFDRGAAVTRSLLGWGVVAGPFYLGLGVVLALTRPDFSLTRDALSLLLLSELGWLHALNLVLSGLMSVAAAVGLARTPRMPRAVAVLVGLYGTCLVLSAVFPPDPSEHYPPGAGGGELTAAGMGHLALGAVGFLGMAAAAVVAGGWFARGGSGAAAWSRLAGVVIAVAFVAGAALAARPAGVGLIWLAVLVTWAWLAAVSVAAYRAVPHPDIARRGGERGS